MNHSGMAVRTMVLAMLVTGCAGPEKPPPPPKPAPTVFEIATTGLTFEAPDAVESGWITFRFRNESAMTHFAVVERMPEGVGVKEQQEQAAPVFQQGMDLLSAGDNDAAMAKFEELPEWFGKVVFEGGPGLTAPGHTSETTVHLEPGTYLLECYVKTNGVFHSYNPEPGVYGMVHEFRVDDKTTAAPEPEADLRVRISGESGIEFTGNPAPGRHTVAVHFVDQNTYENFVGHDVHLVRLDDDTDLDALAAWMDWTRPDGLQTPAPAEFLGGTDEMPSGSTSYVTVDLEPGRYAWIAEVPDPAGRGMLVTFSVAGAT